MIALKPQIRAYRLFSFRRCPFAIRARLALQAANVAVPIVEVSLKAKPQALLALNPKQTVPVLQRNDGSVLCESWDIAQWAWQEGNPDSQLFACQVDPAMHSLVQFCDNDFKYWLDRYKYAERFPEHSRVQYQTYILDCLGKFDSLLAKQAFLFGEQPSLADLACLPFIRQCASVDLDWFARQNLAFLQPWLTDWLKHDLFMYVMHKHRDQLGPHPIV